MYTDAHAEGFRRDAARMRGAMSVEVRRRKAAEARADAAEARVRELEGILARALTVEVDYRALVP